MCLVRYDVDTCLTKTYWIFITSTLNNTVTLTCVRLYLHLAYLVKPSTNFSKNDFLECPVIQVFLILSNLSIGKLDEDKRMF